MYRMRPRLRTHPKLSTKESPLPEGEWMEIVVSNEMCDVHGRESMFKIRNFVALCLTVFLSVMIVGSFAQSSEQSSPDYFPLPIGAVWKYKFITSGGQEFGFTQPNPLQN